MFEGSNAARAGHSSQSSLVGGDVAVDPAAALLPFSRQHVRMVAAAKGWDRRAVERYYGIVRPAAGDAQRLLAVKQAAMKAKASLPRGGAAAETTWQGPPAKLWAKVSGVPATKRSMPPTSSGVKALCRVKRFLIHFES